MSEVKVKVEPKVDVVSSGGGQATSLGVLPTREGGDTVVVLTTMWLPRRSLRELWRNCLLASLIASITHKLIIFNSIWRLWLPMWGQTIIMEGT